MLWDGKREGERISAADFEGVVIGVGGFGDWLDELEELVVCFVAIAVHGGGHAFHESEGRT